MKQHEQAAPKVVMIGARGIPDLEGGVERHIEALVQQYVYEGWQPVVMARRDYLNDQNVHYWHNVKIIPVWAPKSVWLEALLHSLLSLWYARKERPDIVHIHAIGPSLITPIARLMGYKVVVTHHGFDYERQKWGRIGRFALRVGEWCGMRLSHARIAVSHLIKQRIQHDFATDIHYLPNGVGALEVKENTDILRKFELEKQKYILLVARLVPEKRHLDLINAFNQLQLTGYKLVLVGGAGWPKKYQKMLEEQAEASSDIVLTGPLQGDELWAVYAQAALFVLPSSHEGMPLATLEAMRLKVPVLLSDIEANLAFGLSDECYFKMGDITSLTERITNILSGKYDQANIASKTDEVVNQYSWPKIAKQTLDVYSDVLQKVGQK